jgi:hypothetical protein
MAAPLILLEQLFFYQAKRYYLTGDSFETGVYNATASTHGPLANDLFGKFKNDWLFFM